MDELIERERFDNSKVIKDLDEFKAMFDVIVSNHLSKNLLDIEKSLYT